MNKQMQKINPAKRNDGDKTRISISKSGFMVGVQCQKALHMHYNSPELKTPLSWEQQRIVDQGIEVGKLARQLFPGGVDVSDSGMLRGYKLIEATRSKLQKTECILYEAGFESSNDLLNCKVDILAKNKSVTKIVEVKSSTSLKSEYILDVAIQYHVLRESGYSGEVEIYVAYLNNRYVRGEVLNVQELFTIVNVTDEVMQRQSLIRSYISEFQKTLKGQKPEISIGEQCFKPYDCPFRNYCWKDVPEYSVFNLGGIRKSKAAQLFNMGYTTPEELPHDIALNDKQRIEIETAKMQTMHVNRPELQFFLSKLSGPLLFMDFESFNPAIPLHNGTRPYQHLCFQYSVLYQKENKDIIRREFLSDPGIDPRHQFIKSLLEATEEKVPILVYNKVFEITRLREFIANDEFSDHKDQIEERISRIVDVMQPFQARHVYSHLQKGSFSIKHVLPAFSPTKLSYKSMAIKNGAEAMAKYECMKNVSDAERKKIVKDLKDYCYMDVYGLTIILESLKQISNGRRVTKNEF